MARKIYITTVSLQPKTSLRETQYTWGDKGIIETRPTRFPIIPLIEDSALPEDSIKVVAVVTNYDNAKNNFEEFFKPELAQLEKDIGISIELEVVNIEYSENQKNQMLIVSQVSEKFETGAKIYIDTTYGTKVTSITNFCLVTYAEMLCDCEICGIIYGEFNHNTGKSKIFNAKSLYDINCIIQSAQYSPKEEVKKLVDALMEE